MRRPGSARIPTAICRRPASMRVDASNIAITPTSARSARAPSIDGLARIRQGAAQAPPQRRAGPQARAAQPRSRARRRRPPARHRAYPHRQRAICARQQELRRDDACAAATSSETGHRLMMRFTGKHGIVHEVTITDTQPEAHRASAARSCPARCCSNTSMATASRSRSPPATSTTISARRPAATSPPSISAPGARASSPSSRC